MAIIMTVATTNITVTIIILIISNEFDRKKLSIHSRFFYVFCALKGFT